MNKMYTDFPNQGIIKICMVRTTDNVFYNEHGELMLSDLITFLYIAYRDYIGYTSETTLI